MSSSQTNSYKGDPAVIKIAGGGSSFRITGFSETIPSYDGVTGGVNISFLGNKATLTKNGGAPPYDLDGIISSAGANCAIGNKIVITPGLYFSVWPHFLSTPVAVNIPLYSRMFFVPLVIHAFTSTSITVILPFTAESNSDVLTVSSQAAIAFFPAATIPKITFTIPTLGVIGNMAQDTYTISVSNVPAAAGGDSVNSMQLNKLTNLVVSALTSTTIEASGYYCYANNPAANTAVLNAITDPASRVTPSIPIVNASLLYSGTRYSVAAPVNVTPAFGGNSLKITPTSTTSAGGINSASISGTFSQSLVGVPILITPDYYDYKLGNDSSDQTRALRERLIYNEKRTNTTIGLAKRGSLVPGGHSGTTPAGVNHLPAGNAELLWQQQGNQFRLSYLFGKLKCAAIDGNAYGCAFNLNGPNSFNVSGAQSGS